MEKNARIYIAGQGMVGTAILNFLKEHGYENILLRSSEELDLTSQKDVASFFQEEKPEYVFLAAAKVGGIEANNTLRAQFIYENLMIQNNVIHHSYLSGVKKLLFLASSCVYPKMAPQPIKEEYLLTGDLEPTNEPYAIAKIAGIKMCENYNRQYGTNFISVMPTNLYGPGDNYDPASSHVLPALMYKFHNAKTKGEDLVEVWGSGTPRREFMHVNDLASACFHLMQNYNKSKIVNIGTGKDMSIRELVEIVIDVVGYTGKVVWNREKPDGTPRKLLDVSLIKKLGWVPEISLKDGIRDTYEKKFLINN